MRVLITGGAGFIGRSLSDQFAGDELHVLDNLSTGKEPRPFAKLHVMDLRDAGALRTLVRDLQPDLVLHCAAQVSVSLSVENPAYDRAVNLDGTRNLLDALTTVADTPDFVFFSSCAIYGTSAEPDEDTPPDPLSPYAENKMLAEEVLLSADHVSPLIVRPANIYGVGQLPPAVVPAIVAAAAQGRSFRLEGDGTQERDLLHVRDLGRAIALLLSPANGPRTFNAAGGAPVRLIDILALAEDVFGRPLPLEHAPSRSGDVYLSRPRVDRLRAAGFRPQVSLLEGLRELWQVATTTEGSAS